MLKFDLVQTDKHSTIDLLQPKNLQFSSRTNLNTKPVRFNCPVLNLHKKRDGYFILL
jgi:hypothetical protein